MNIPEIIKEHPIIEEVLTPHREKLGLRWTGVRSHCYRMLNFIEYFAPSATPKEIDRTAIVAAWHDIPVFLKGDMDYLDEASDLAIDYLKGHGDPEWEDEVRLMIQNHHHVTPYVGPHQRTVEATRKADWIDVSIGFMRFGIPEDYLMEMNVTFPIESILPFPAWIHMAKYALNHPERPFPYMKW